MTAPDDRPPVDPSIEGMLAILSMPDAPRLATKDVATARIQFRTLTVETRRPWSIIDVAAVEDVTVDGADGSLPARVYRPGDGYALAGPDGTVPTIVFFHGGWLRAGRPRHPRQPVPLDLP